MLPFVQYPFPKRNVSLVLGKTQLYGMGQHITRATFDTLKKTWQEDNCGPSAEEEEDADWDNTIQLPVDLNDPFGPDASDTSRVPLGGQSSKTDTPHPHLDRWGREPAVHLEGAKGGNTLLFVHRDSQAWDRVLKYRSTANKKKTLDGLLSDAYRTHVLRRGDNSERMACAFYARAQLALEHYCALRGWSYGRDALITCNGRAIGEKLLPPWQLMGTAAADRMSNSSGFSTCPWTEQAYEVFLRDASPGSCADVKRLMLYVVYSVEMLMRADGAAQWCMSESELASPDLLESLRQIDPSIFKVSNAGSHHSDVGVYNVRPLFDCGLEGTVVKNCSSLVFPPLAEQQRNRRSHTQTTTASTPPATDATNKNNNKRNYQVTLDVPEARRGSSTFLPVYVTYSDDSTGFLASDASESVRLLHDFSVTYTEPRTETARPTHPTHPTHPAQQTAKQELDPDAPATSQTQTIQTTRNLRCTGRVLSVDILGASNWRRTFTLDCLAANPTGMMVYVPVRGVGFVVPGSPIAWQSAMQGLFEWMNRAALDIQHVSESVVREKALRVFWWSAALLAWRQQGMDSQQPPEVSLSRGQVAPQQPGGEGTKRRRRETWTALPQMSTTSRPAPRLGGGNRRSDLSHSPSSSSATTSTTPQPTPLSPRGTNEAITMLQNFQMGISVPDRVEVDGMHMTLTYPFDEVWKASHALMSNVMDEDDGDKREWFKELLASTAVSVCAALQANRPFDS